VSSETSANRSGDAGNVARLRVLHVIPSLSREHGGPTLAVRQMLAAMVSTDILLQVATTDDGEPMVNAHHTVFLFRKIFHFYKFAPAFVFWFWRRAKSYDVVHIHTLFSFMTTVSGVICRLRGVPYVLRPLGTLAPYGLSQRRPLLKRLSMALIEGPLLRHAAAVHFTSNAELQEAQRLNCTFRPVVIPLAAESDPESRRVDVPVQSATKRSDKKTVLYLSRLDPKKNVEALLQAFAGVHKKVPDSRLVVAGGGVASYVTSLKRLCNELDISFVVEWVGFASGEAKAKLFDDATLYVLPSFAENFGIAVAEALAAGVPCVVSTGVALASDIVEYSAGRAVEPTTTALEDAIVEMLGNDSELSLASSNARRLATERFSMSAMRERLTNLYNRVSVGEQGASGFRDVT
jgi:glycosyltransferase involved in cell wall biosynthesis